MRYLYLLLSRSTSLPARIISLFTGDSYTHSSLAFDEPLTTLCSFARKYQYTPFPGGLIHEHLQRGFMGSHPHIKCKLYRLAVSEAAYAQAKVKVDDMFLEQKKYHYSIRGVLLCHWQIPQKRPYKYFCSQFVAEVLEECGAAVLPKDPSLMHPEDFFALEGLETLYEGTVGELAARLYPTMPQGNTFSA